MSKKNYSKNGKGIVIGLVIVVVIIVLFLASKSNWSMMKDNSKTIDQDIETTDSDLPNTAPEMFSPQTTTEEE